MKICITGASGFLGSWTSHRLSEDFDVFAITRFNSSTENLGLNKNIEVVSEKFEKWAGIINDISPDVLIMHDWQGVGNTERNNPAQYSNVDRVMSLVTSLKPISQVIGVGSQAELGPRSDEIFDQDPSNPTSDYGRAKCKLRDLLINHFEGTTSNFKWGRIFSTYGAMDEGDWLIPNLIKSLNVGKPFPLTSGTQEWNYLHAYDASEAFRALALAGKPGIYNIGHPQTSFIRDVCIEIAQIMGKDQQLLQFGEIPMRPDQVTKLQVSTTKLQATGWKPMVNMSEGLVHTVDWICKKPETLLELNDGRKIGISQ
jgi:nucleoside-diphosphate-sugar epimerase